MKQRNLDDIYIRAEVDGKWETRCLTDLPWETVSAWLAKRMKDDPEYRALGVIEHLHARLRRVGDELGISARGSDEEIE